MEDKNKVKEEIWIETSTTMYTQKSDLVYNIDHMRNSGIELSSKSSWKVKN